MKKLFTIAIGMLFVAAFAFGQSNQSTVTQNGSSNDASVDQTGPSNVSIIDQDQSFGGGHTAVVNQTSNPGAAGNLADLWQNQSSAEAYVTQVGASNQARSKQSGYNVLNVEQVGNGNVLGQYNDYSGRAFQKNGGGYFATDMNQLDLTQHGDANMAGTWQEHHAEAAIVQSGNENAGRVYQSGSPFGTINSASIDQNGDYNVADLHQFGDGNSATAYLGHPNYTSNLNKATVDQTGDGNNASFSMFMGDNNTASISQNGNDNNSEYSVKYGDENTITANVQGDQNRTRLHINADWGMKSSGNTVTVTKTGFKNYVAGAINGDGNVVTITQTGDNNRVGTSWYTTGDGVSITGNANNVTIDQMSNGNQTFQTINGDGNTISVSQN